MNFYLYLWLKKKNVRLRKYTEKKFKTPDRSGWKSLKKKETSICSEQEDSRRGGMEQREKICKKCGGTNKHGVATVTTSSRKI